MDTDFLIESLISSERQLRDKNKVIENSRDMKPERSERAREIKSGFAHAQRESWETELQRKPHDKEKEFSIQ